MAMQHKTSGDDSHPVLRFAPSPNGRLHLGHAYSALFTRQWANRLGGQFILRIEDIDTQRCKPEFVNAVLDDLAWLGLTWPEPVWRQSQRFPAYREAADKLRALGLLYPCFCSRSDIAKAQSPGTDPEGTPLYPGTCKHLSPTDIAKRLEWGDPVNWRLDTDVAYARTGMLTYSTAEPTPIDRPRINYAKPQKWGDVVLVRKDTPTSYHLSVVVDDAAQGITHVTRGKDLQAATDIHILLQMLLGLPSPLYTHHRLITGDDKLKLSKSAGSTSLADLRNAGWTAEAVREHLGFDEMV